MVLGRSRDLCEGSWAALGAYIGGFGPLLGPMLAVLGRSRGICGRAEVVLGPLWVVLGCSRGLCERSWDVIRPESGPGSSGSSGLKVVLSRQAGLAGLAGMDPIALGGQSPFSRQRSSFCRTRRTQAKVCWKHENFASPMIRGKWREDCLV